ncbi:MAG: hypothetical protein RLO80_13155 [Hyphomonas sp.]
MKLQIPAALVMSIALTGLAAPAAFAEAPVSQFRSVEAQSFSTDELQRYGLSEADAATVRAYQEQGYAVQLLTPEEAEAYNAGMSNTNILALIGLVAIVVVVASAI